MMRGRIGPVAVCEAAQGPWVGPGMMRGRIGPVAVCEAAQGP